jgi:hypothetical protein
LVQNSADINAQNKWNKSPYEMTNNKDIADFYNKICPNTNTTLGNNPGNYYKELHKNKKKQKDKLVSPKPLNSAINHFSLRISATKLKMKFIITGMLTMSCIAYPGAAARDSK